MDIQSLQTDTEGRFAFEGVISTAGPGATDYVTAQMDQLALLSVLGESSSAPFVINELTTVASVFTHAQFINGTTISGPALGLKIAAGNVPNFANLHTGDWGDVTVDANNWNRDATVVSDNPDRKLSTNGGGNGIVVFYGLATPVKTPLMGQVRPL
tara:strand:+ start:54932 stop:55399 length:468 start_codon:yes stop_codon:yes gene_type:complete